MRSCSTAFEKVGAVLVKCWVVLGVVFIVCPLPIVIISSFTEANLVYFPPKGFSLKWYVGLLEKTEYLRSFLVSLRLAFVAVAVALVFGTMVAVALTRFKFRFTNTLRTFFLSPLMIPGVIFGLAACASPPVSAGMPPSRPCCACILSSAALMSSERCSPA